MKIIKFSYMPIIAMLLLTVAWGCSTEDLVEPASGAESTTDAKLYIPVINGSVGEYTDGDLAATTKAGFIEDNSEYAKGEKFYWTEGDEIKLLFFKKNDSPNPTDDPTELTYKILATDKEKKNTCNFELVSGEGLEAGDYTVYALYPADGWIYEDGVYRIKTLEKVFVQEDATSKSMGKYMYMKTDAYSFSIKENQNYDYNPLYLKFKQLMSFVRFNITDDFAGFRPNSVFNRITFGINPIPGIGIPGENKLFFPKNAYLKSLDANELTTEDGGYNDLVLKAGSNFKGNNGKYTLFMPLLPTRAPKFNEKLGETLSIKAYISISKGTPYYVESKKDYEKLSFYDDIKFLKDGFKPGHSYCFNLKMNR